MPKGRPSRGVRKKRARRLKLEMLKKKRNKRRSELRALRRW